MEPDLIYYQDKLFTRFIPETDAGVVAYNEMATQQQCGTATVLNLDAARVIQQLRSAGYKVAKGKETKKWVASDDELLAELMA